MSFLLCIAELGIEASTCAEIIRILQIESESDMQRNVPGFSIWKPAHNTKGFPPKPALLEVTVERNEIQNVQRWKKLFGTTKRANCVAIITLISMKPQLGSCYKASHEAPAWQGSSQSPSTTRSASSPDNLVLVFALIQNHYASWSGKNIKQRRKLNH